MGYQKYVKGGAQGGGAGGDHEQYVDCSKCMQGDARKGGAQTFVAAGNGKDASDNRADDNADASQVQVGAAGGAHKQYMDYLSTRRAANRVVLPATTTGSSRNGQKTTREASDM